MGILSNVEDELITELPRFFENYDRDIKKLNEYLENRNAEEIKSTVHRIKGSSGSWGFDAIQKAAAKLEKAAQTGDWSSIQSRLTKLIDTIDVSKQAVEEEFESHD